METSCHQLAFGVCVTFILPGIPGSHYSQLYFAMTKKNVQTLIGTLGGFFFIPGVKDRYKRYAWSLLSTTLGECLIASELQPLTVCGAVNSERNECGRREPEQYGV